MARLQRECEMKTVAASAARYRNKSEEVRVIADSMKNDKAQQFMMSVADDYVILAEMFERLLPNDSVHMIG